MAGEDSRRLVPKQGRFLVRKKPKPSQIKVLDHQSSRFLIRKTSQIKLLDSQKHHKSSFLIRKNIEVETGFEPALDGFANRCLTAWLPHRGMENPTPLE
jgi:hypothetical protein